MFSLSDLTDLDYIMFLTGLLIGAVIVTTGILIGQSFKRKEQCDKKTKIANKTVSQDSKVEKLLIPTNKPADKPPEKARKACRYIYRVPGVETPFETLKEAVKQFPIDPKYYDNPTWQNIPGKVRDTIKREAI